MTKKLLFVTGTRADFGKVEPLAIKARDAGYYVSFWVTGMHMLNKYGLTKLEVERVNGVDIFEFKNQNENDENGTTTIFSRGVAKWPFLFCSHSKTKRPENFSLCLVSSVKRFIKHT